MRAIVTGQIGVDKKPYLKAVKDAAELRGEPLELFNLGDMMYREAPDVRPGRILDLPISRQTMPERPVSIGDGSWIGHGTVVLPGATIGRHVTIGANSVVTGTIPDFCVAVGNPARVIKRYVDGEGWQSVG